MATENKRMAQRIDTLTNWNTNNPLIQPGEVCLIQGSTDYRVNVSNAPTNFSNCQLFKGSDTTSTSANDGRTTLYRSTGVSLGSWSANQSTNDNITLPNFVGDAKVGYKDAATAIKTFMNTNWTPRTTVTTRIPNAIPTDLVCCILRDFAYQLETHGNVPNAITLARTALLNALEFVPDLDR